jgi:hypothetical protein
MSNARIEQGKWVRRVPWRNGGVWRTDMFKSVLADERLRIAEFQLKGGPTVRVPKSELVRVLVGGPDHYDGQIWGPFNIDPKACTIAGIRVEMEVQE